MELAWLEDFIALADALSFSRAAEARNVTQPAFSRRIRALENWVGAALFERTTHSVALTPAGTRFRAQAEGLARSIHQMRRDALEAAGLGGGPIGVAATHALSFTFFPKWVRRNDGVMALGALNLISDSMEACERMMLRGDAQLLLRHHHPATRSRLDAPQFTSVVVGSDRLEPFCAPGADGVARWRVDGAEPIRLLAYSDRSGLGRIVATHWDAGDRGGAVETAFTSQLAATLLSMARAGEGVAWLPRMLAEDDLAAGRLTAAGGPDLSISIEIRLFRPATRQSRLVEAAWSALTASPALITSDS